VEIQKQAIRNGVSHGKHLLTYSAEFNSGCFPLLERDFDLSKALREEVKVDDGRQPFRWPVATDAAYFRKPGGVSISESRKAELQAPWIENEMRPELETAEVVKGAFDAKTLGTGGSHVIPLRRVGFPGSTLDEPAPPPPQEHAVLPPMRFATGYASSGTKATIDKYSRTILDGKPSSLGLSFDRRAPPKSLTKKYGSKTRGMPSVPNVGTSLNVDEVFQELEMGNSEYPNQYIRSIARPVVASRLPNTGTCGTVPQGTMTMGRSPRSDHQISKSDFSSKGSRELSSLN
jgi:hypothetical protein